MADKSLRYVVSAVDKNAGKTIGDVAKHGSKAAATIGSAFGKLSGVLGGEVGELAWICRSPGRAVTGSWGRLAASHLEGLKLYMQSDHLLPLVPDMLPQERPQDNRPRPRPCGRTAEAAPRRED